MAARTQRAVSLVVSFLVAYGLHVLFKTLISIEASRRISDDRQSGALELLLATPLPNREIIKGQWRALHDQFKIPLGAVALMNLALFWQMAFPNPLQLPGKPQSMFCWIFVGGLVLLVSDYYALGWIGMAQALRSRRHHRAVLGTLGRVMMPPWIGIFLLFMLANLGIGIQDNTATAILMVYFAACALGDVLAGSKARSQLVEHFRS